jgi:integrase
MFPDGRWGLLHVRHGWDKVEGEIDPKSRAGVRTVPVCEQLYALLSEHLQRLGRSHGLVFGRTAETHFSYSGVRDRTMRAWKDAGVEPHDFQFHECRHTFRTFMAAAGIPRDRRDRYTGHADHSVGARYEHRLDHQYLDDALALTDYLKRADTPTRLRDNRATVSDSPERSGAGSSGSEGGDSPAAQTSRTPHDYAESESGSGGGGI